MATHLDLQEQEQLAQLKHFWTQYGTLITWLLVAVLSVYVGLNAWNWWQRDEAGKAGALFMELEKAANAGDAEKTGRVFSDMKDRFGRTGFAEQGALLAAKVQFEKGHVDAAQASLTWASEHAVDSEYQTVAHLRLAGLLVDQKKYEEALKQLDSATTKEFSALVADRRGDILMAQGKQNEAREAYMQAWKAMDESVEYRRLVEAKLVAMGADPVADKSTGAATAVAGDK